MQASRQRHQANGGQGNNLLPTLPAPWGEASPVRNRRGFTLLELLVVIAILAGTAFIASSTFKGVGAHADERLVLTEMQQIAQALRQFKQDTGYYPREGIFKRTTEGGRVLPTSPLSPTGASDYDWFYSPANLYQLLATTSPLDGSGHPLTKWDAETGRGWRGPYLTGFSDGRVTIGTAINPANPDNADTHTSNPSSGADTVNVVGVADSFKHKEVNGKFAWTSVPAGDAWGRPYLFFQTAASPAHWSLISMGPDGKYENGIPTPGSTDDDNDNIVLPIE